MKKILLLIIFIIFSYMGSFAQNRQPHEVVTFRFVPGDDMFYTPWEGNDAQLDRLYSLIDKYRAEIIAGTMPVYVDAYSASMRERSRNMKLAFIRANRVKSELILRKGLVEENFITKNYAAVYTDPDGTAYKDMVVVTLSIPAKPEPLPEKPEPKPEPAPAPQPDPVVESQPEPISEPEPVPAPVSSGNSGLDIRTNLLYDALLLPTIGIEWHVNEHVGIKVDGSWSHWGSSKGRVQKIWLVSPEVRWYLLDAKRFYVGLGANFGQANIYKGLANVLSGHTGYQGNIYGGGLTVGYRLPLCDGGRLAMDFNLGLGITHFKYDTFTVSNDYRVYKERSLSKNFWGPTQAGISLIWRVGRK